MRRAAALLAAGAAYALLRGIPEQVPALVRICMAVLMLVGGLALWRGLPGPSGERMRGGRRAGWMDYAGLGAGVLAVECLLVVYFSVVPRQLENLADRLEWAGRSGPGLSEESRGGAGTRRGNWLWEESGRRELPRRTNFKPGTRPEVFIRPESEGDAKRMLGGPVYVGAFALGAYDDGVWTEGTEETQVLTAGNDGWVRFSQEQSGEAVQCRIYHGRDAGSHPVVGLQGLVAARVPALVRRNEGLHVLLESEAGVAGYEYDTVSRPRRIEDLDPDAAVSGDADRWLELPGGETGARIGLLATRAAGAGSDVERLARLKRFLREGYGYSLVTRNPADRDPLENFLFHERRGHCELFATAGVMMARALGMPARVAYGWHGGTYYEASGLFVFRAREAHAWVEVLVEGEGWVVMDPTPPADSGGAEPRTAAAGEPIPEFSELETEVISEMTGEEIWPWALGLGATAGLLGSAMLFLRHRGPARCRGTGLRAPVEAGYLVELRKGCRERGIPLSPGMTVRAMIGSLKEAPDFAGELEDYHYAVNYEGRRRSPETERDFVRSLKVWNTCGV